MPLSLGHSAWLLALAAGVAALLTWWVYRRSTPPLEAGRRMLLGGLRFAALAIVLFLLFEPVWRQISETETPAAVAVLLDESQSVRVTAAGSTGAATDSASSDASVRSAVRQALAGLGGGELSGAQVHVFGFSDGARRLASGDVGSETLGSALDSLRFEGSVTNLSTALEGAGEALRDDNLRAVVLASDGQYNTGRNPLYQADRSPVPIHTIVLGDTTRRRDVVLRRAEANDLAYAGTEVVVRASVQAEGYTGEQVRVSLYDGAERLDAQSVTLPEGSATSEQRVDLTFQPEDAGLKRLTVGVARMDGEATYRNNTQPVTLRVLDQKRQVLLVGAAPGPTVSATRRLLESDPAAEVTARIARAPGRFYGGVLPDSLAGFDVAVLAGFPGDAASAQDARRLAEAIGNGGLPAFFLLTQQTDLRALQDHFADVLPATPERIRTSTVEAVFVPTAAGRRHPVFDLPGVSAGAGRADSTAWSRLPPLRRSQTRWQAAPDARTLATARVRGVNTGDPLLLVQRRSGQRAAMLLGAGTWRWANLPEALSAAAPLWPGLLSGLVQWTSAAENDQPVRVEPAQTTFAGGAPVRLAGQVYDERLQPVGDAAVEVVLTDSAGTRYPFQMQSLGDGRYELQADALPPGRYDYAATATREDQTLGTDQGTFAVGRSVLEFRHTRANAALMRQLAQRSGGSFHDAGSDSLGAAVARAGLAPRVEETPRETRLWERYAFLAAALALLGAEWVLRRRSGMA